MKAKRPKECFASYNSEARKACIGPCPKCGGECYFWDRSENYSRHTKIYCRKFNHGCDYASKSTYFRLWVPQEQVEADTINLHNGIRS